VPFQAPSLPALVMKVCSSQPAPLDNRSRELNDLVSGLLQKDPGKRWSLQEILGFPLARASMEQLLNSSRHYNSGQSGDFLSHLRALQLSRDSDVEVPRTPKAVRSEAEPQTPKAPWEVQDSVHADYHANRQAARRSKHRHLSLSPDMPGASEARHVEASLPEETSVAARRRKSKKLKEAEEAAQLQALEAARKEALQDRLVAKERHRRSQSESWDLPEPMQSPKKVGDFVPPPRPVSHVNLRTMDSMPASDFKEMRSVDVLLLQELLEEALKDTGGLDQLKEPDRTLLPGDLVPPKERDSKVDEVSSTLHPRDQAHIILSLDMSGDPNSKPSPDNNQSLDSLAFSASLREQSKPQLETDSTIDFNLSGFEGQDQLVMAEAAPNEESAWRREPGQKSIVDDEIMVVASIAPEVQEVQHVPHQGEKATRSSRPQPKCCRVM